MAARFESLSHPIPSSELFEAEDRLLVERGALNARLEAILAWLHTEAAGEELGVRAYEQDSLVLEAQSIYERIDVIDMTLAKLNHSKEFIS